MAHQFILYLTCNLRSSSPADLLPRSQLCGFVPQISNLIFQIPVLQHSQPISISPAQISLRHRCPAQIYHHYGFLDAVLFSDTDIFAASSESASSLELHISGPDFLSDGELPASSSSQISSPLPPSPHLLRHGFQIRVRRSQSRCLQLGFRSPAFGVRHSHSSTISQQQS